MHGVDFVERQVIKVYKKGIIALARNIRERLKIEEGDSSRGIRGGWEASIEAP
jgi:hypothetical protein